MQQLGHFINTGSARTTEEAVLCKRVNMLAVVIMRLINNNRANGARALLTVRENLNVLSQANTLRPGSLRRQVVALAKQQKTVCFRNY